MSNSGLAKGAGMLWRRAQNMKQSFPSSLCASCTTLSHYLLLFSSSLCASWHGSSLKTAYVVHSLCGMFLPQDSEASNECIQKPPWVLLINDAPSDKRGLQGGKTIQQRSGFASLWFLMLLPVLWLMPLCSLHTCMCVYWCHSSLMAHTVAP